jgi:hypothetical protein
VWGWPFVYVPPFCSERNIAAARVMTSAGCSVTSGCVAALVNCCKVPTPIGLAHRNMLLLHRDAD